MYYYARAHTHPKSISGKVAECVKWNTGLWVRLWLLIHGGGLLEKNIGVKTGEKTNRSTSVIVNSPNPNFMYIYNAYIHSPISPLHLCVGSLLWSHPWFSWKLLGNWKLLPAFASQYILKQKSGQALTLAHGSGSPTWFSPQFSKIRISVRRQHLESLPCVRICFSVFQVDSNGFWLRWRTWNWIV